MVKATSLLVLISRFIVPPGGICHLAFFTTPMGPAIVVVTTINFDSLPQPQDSPFSRNGSDSPVPNTFTAQAEVKQILRLQDFPSCTLVALVGNGSWFHLTTPNPEKSRMPAAAVNFWTRLRE